MTDEEPKPNLGGRPPIDGQRGDAWIQLRTTGARKGAYVRAAHGRDMKLSQWVFEQLDKAAGYTPANASPEELPRREKIYVVTIDSLDVGAFTSAQAAIDYLAATSRKNGWDISDKGVAKVLKELQTLTKGGQSVDWDEGQDVYISLLLTNPDPADGIPRL